LNANNPFAPIFVYPLYSGDIKHTLNRQRPITEMFIVTEATKGLSLGEWWSTKIIPQILLLFEQEFFKNLPNPLSNLPRISSLVANMKSFEKNYEKLENYVSQYLGLVKNSSNNFRLLSVQLEELCNLMGESFGTLDRATYLSFNKQIVYLSKKESNTIVDIVGRRVYWINLKALELKPLIETNPADPTDSIVHTNIINDSLKTPSIFLPMHESLPGDEQSVGDLISFKHHDISLIILTPILQYIFAFVNLTCFIHSIKSYKFEAMKGTTTLIDAQTPLFKEVLNKMRENIEKFNYKGIWTASK
jgi:hypothetical protein